MDKNKRVQSIDFSDPIDISGVPRDRMESEDRGMSRAEKLAYKQSLSAAAPSPVAAPEVREPAPLPQQPANQGSNWDWGEIMIGATPALAGILMGDTAVGYSVAGQGLLDRQKQIIDLNKERAKAMREAAGKMERGRFQARAIEKDGKTYYRTYDTATGKFITPEEELLTGFKQTVREDPTTGELIKITGAGGVEDIRGRKSAPYTVKQQKEGEKVRKELLSDEKFSKARSTMNSTQRALSLLQAKNPVADEGIKTIFPRMFGEVGNLAFQEQERFSGSPAVQRKWGRLYNKWKEGTLTNEDRADLMEVAEIMYEYDKQNLNQALGSFVKSEKNLRGYDPTSFLKPFVQEELATPRGTVGRARGKAPTRGKPAFVRQGGVLFELQANGEYEAVEE